MLGLKNEVDPKYPDIIWFKLGTYVITSFSYAYSTSGMSISISGKDKMCLINGDVGGEIYASVDFGTREEIDDDGNKTLVDINIEDIIREAVHEYGHEPWERIIIQDIPKYGLYLLEWNGDKPMQALIPTDGSDEAANVYINQDQIVYEDNTAIKISEISSYLSTNELNLVNKEDYTVITTTPDGERSYYVCKINPGQTAGYDVTELTYPRNGEESGLITSVGDSVTSVLDKIVDFLGNYEYFFDVEGNFIFQKKDKWIDTNWNANDFDTVSMGNDYTLLSYLPTTWLFEGNDLVVSFNNSPNIGNIKNDYAIWGERNSGDITIPIHMRQAVDKKPVYYKSISVTKDELDAYKELYPEFKDGFKNVDGNGNWNSVVYYTEDFDESLVPVGIEAHKEDWRELIYQMALDYRRFNHFDTFNARILQNNMIPNAAGGMDILYPSGITGYEQYYVDLEGFWRYLYKPDYDSGTSTGYSIKTPEELDLNEDIYIRDHWYNVADKLLGDDYNEYYVTYVGEPESGGPAPERLLVENPHRINPEFWFEQGCHVWEVTTPNKVWEMGFFDYYVYRPSQYYSSEDHKYYDRGNQGFYYDNGAAQNNRYDANGNLLSPNAYVRQYRTDKYNLLIAYREDVTESELQDICSGDPLSPESTINYKKFNTSTVYKVDEGVYQMLENENHNWVMKRVKTPILTGIQYYGSEEYVYRFNGDRSIYSKVGILNTLPSTFTYQDFYMVPDDDMATYSTAHVWEKFKDKHFFTFTGEDTFENSALYLSKGNNSYINLANEPSYVQALVKYGDSDYYNNYTYIKQNLYSVPVLDDNNDYLYTHLPIAQYQDTYYYDYAEGYTGKWNTLVKESPELLLFWFDFLDSQGSEIGKYGVNNVMDRSKASNESNVKAIYYRDTLNIVYQRTSKVDDKRQNKLVDYTRSGYNIMQCGDWVQDQFKISDCGKSCKDVLDQWLYQYTQANETISINCIPIYILEPNNRISIHDDNIKINGEYVINSINIPLTYSGTMSINAIKAVDKLQ